MNAPRYRGYDAAQLTRQYSPSLTIQGAAAHVRRWGVESARFRAAFGGRTALDVRYAEHPAARLDVFSNARDGAPVHVYIHGGYWQRTGKSDYSYLAAALTDRGACCVVPDYTLCPATTVAGIVEETRCALAWVYREIGRYGGDPRRIHLSGHSAGGHLVAMMAATDWPSHGAGLPADLVKSGLSISGVFDLEPLLHTPINDALGLDLETARELSPLFRAAAREVPMAFAVGARESDEFRRQSDAMRGHWREAGAWTRAIDCPDRHHLDVIDLLAERDGALFKQAVEFAFGSNE